MEGFFYHVANNKLKKKRESFTKDFCDLKYERALQSSLRIRKSDENVIVDMEDLYIPHSFSVPFCTARHGKLVF